MTDRLKDAREALGWTREILAAYSGVSASTIGRIERGEMVPRAGSVIALAVALKIPAEELAVEVGRTLRILSVADREVVTGRLGATKDALESLRVVAEAHAEATAAARAAADLRAVAAWQARCAGATLGQLAETLRIARPNIPALVRRGEQLAT